MDKNRPSPLKTSHGIYLIYWILFSGITMLYSFPLALIELGVAFLTFLYLRRSGSLQKKETLYHIQHLASSMDHTTQQFALHSPLPTMLFQPDSDKVIWVNQGFLALVDQRKPLFEVPLSAAIPSFDTRWLMEGKGQCPDEIFMGEKRFRVFGSIIQEDPSSQQPILATTYWIDVTHYSQTLEQYHLTRPVVAILLIDNFEDATKGADEAESSGFRTKIHQALTSWVHPSQGLFLRYDRERFLFLFEERYLTQFQEDRFDILDTIHDIPSLSTVPATLSIGIGRGANDLKEAFDHATLSLEMALSRGGDQAVIKCNTSFEFYGGRNKEMEKRTKVKSRVMANALADLISDSSRVLVMGHKFSDLDCVGGCAGICAIARSRGIPAHIVRESGNNPAHEMFERLAQLPEYSDAFLTTQDALVIADTRTLLVVVDTNRPEQVVCQSLLECCTRVAVIDHHRRAASYIANAVLNFHEPYASSASELVTELLQYILEPSDLLRIEAEAVLAGIVLDTKNFTMRTGTRTFEAAAFLRRSGADTGDVKKLFQNDLSGTIARYDIIRKATLHRGHIAIAALEHSVKRVTAAQASDELLNIAGIDASFVLFPEEESGQIIVSARSMGETNVQVVLEKLGGGGTGATAGAQISDSTIPEVLQALMDSMNQHLDEKEE